MVDTVSLLTSAGSSSSVTQTLAQRASATTTTGSNSASSGRTIDDVVDLSTAGRLAQELRDSGALSGKQFAAKLSDSLKEGKGATDALAAKLKGGKTSAEPSDDEFNSAVRATVYDIMRAGKPSDVIDGIIRKLFPR